LASRERKNNFTALAVKQRIQSADKSKMEIQNWNFWIVGRKSELIGADDVSIDQNQNGIFAFGGLAEQGIDRRIWRAQTREFCAVKKARMIRDEFVELREFGDDVVGAVPIQTGVAVDADFFGGQPFDAASKTESAVRTRERAKAVSQQ